MEHDPDDELLDLAIKANSVILPMLDKQVSRMPCRLASVTLASISFHEWLDMKRLERYCAGLGRVPVCFRPK